jgi:hypothetical protein
MLDELPKHISEPQTRSSDSSKSLSAVIASALDQPMDYPAVNEWMFPGDSIAIVLQTNLPRPLEVVGVVLDYFQREGIELDDVLLVIAPATAKQFGISADQLVQTEAEIANGQPPKILPVKIDKRSLNAQVHDQSNTFGLAYLAANEAGDAVHVNRRLVDADVVFPVGCPTSGNSAEGHDTVYPEFGSTDRAEPFRARTESAAQRANEIRLANDNLGSFFSLQIVFSPGGDASHAVSGQRTQVVSAATEFANEQWTIEPTQHAELVIATIEEPGREQTWDDFASAVTTAAGAAEGDGPIVIWSEISQEPDPDTCQALQRQFDETEASELPKQLQSVASITSERPVFLRSSLPQSSIEDLGIGFINDEQDVYRIAAKATKGVLLRDAHRVNLKSPQASQ